MSPKELIIILNAVYSKLVWKETLDPTAPNQMIVSNLKNINEAAKMLDGIELFTGDLKKYFASKLPLIVENETRLMYQDAVNIKTEINNVQLLISSSLNALKTVSPEDQPDSISIRFPNYVKSFSDVANVSEQFETLLSQIIYHQDISNSTIEITSVENGSMWFTALVGRVAMRIIGDVAWAACVIRKKKAEGDMAIEHVRQFKGVSDAVEILKTGLEESMKELLELEAKHIANAYYTDSHNEDVERVKNSIKMLTELIYQGAEIRPAISAQEEVKNLYPEYKNILGIVSKVKEIEGPKNND